MSKLLFFRILAVSLVTCVLASASMADEPAAKTEPAKSPSEGSEAQSADTISIDLWIVAVRVPEKGSDGAQHGQRSTRLDSLPTILGSRDDAISLIRQLDDEKAIVKLEKARLAAVPDREAEVAVGWHKPKITATSITQMGTTNAIVVEPLGTFVHVTPRVNSDGTLSASLKLETTTFLKANDVPISVPNKGDSTFAQTAASFQLNTEVRMKNGAAILVSATPSHDLPEADVQLVILSASR